ncbi:hypothetical protein [Paenibacillus kandeliae]|uniref:hypothetical protein n=1 Tax=Paenibacillus kandeliae TaxID=3231269 RepID=UPI00345984D6
MRISKVIKQTMLKELEKMNFKYRYHHNRWEFSRDCGTYTETITIDKSDWIENSIRVEFGNGEESITSFKLMKIDGEHWYTYQNEQELKQILIGIVELIKTHVLDWWANNRPKNIYPSKLKKLLEEYSKYQNLMYEYNLKSFSPDDLQKAENLLTLDAELDVILMVTYFLGEMIIANLEGQWEYSEPGLFYISHIGGNRSFKKDLFREIYLCQNSNNSLMIFYKSLSETVHILNNQ